MELRIILSKEVTDEAEAQTLVDIVKAKLSDNPDVKVEASTYQKLPKT